MGFYDVNYGTLVKQLLPVRLRQAIMYAWMSCCVTPVKELLAVFQAWRLANLYVLAHNGQVCYLEAALNDVFDAEQRRIYINDPSYFDPVYLYQPSEEKPVGLYQPSENLPVALYQPSECYTGSGTSFIVNVPALLALSAGQLTRLRAVVNYYRLPGRVYEVVIV